MLMATLQTCDGKIQLLRMPHTCNMKHWETNLASFQFWKLLPILQEEKSTIHFITNCEPLELQKWLAW